MMAEIAPSVSQAIPVLREGGFQAWSYRIELHLKRLSLWENVIVNVPAQPTAEQQRNNEKALAIIGLSLADDQLCHVRGVTSAARCWEILRAIHVRTSASSKVHLSRKLYRTVLKEGGDMNRHLQILQELFQDLQQLDVIFTEEQKAYLILSSLPPAFDHLVTSLESLPVADLTVQYLTGRLIDEARRREERKPVKDSSQQGKNTLNVVKRCHGCGSRNHFVRDCDKRKNISKSDSARSQVHGGRQKLSILNVCGQERKSVWVLDSGASTNVCCANPSKFSDFHRAEEESVCLADGRNLKVAGKGSLYIECLGKICKDVLCIPTLSYNLLSVASLDRQGYSVHFEKGLCKVMQNENVCAIGKLRNGLYEMQKVKKEMFEEEEHKQVAIAENTSPHTNCIHDWHQKLGHLNYKTVQKMPLHVEGMNITKCDSYVPCEVCHMTKAKVQPIPKKSNRVSNSPFQIVYADLAGPFHPSHGLAKYFLLIVDDFSRFSFLFPIKKKSEVFTVFTCWVKFVERKFDTAIKELITDGGGEYTSEQFESWLKKRGIFHKRNCPYTPWQSGLVERHIQTVNNMKNCLLRDSKLPNTYWAEAALTSVYILNRIVHSATGETPFYLVYGRKPGVGHFRNFGETAFVQIPKQQRRKGQPKAKKCRFLGYDTSARAWRFVDSNQKVITSRNATFVGKAVEKEPDSVLLPHVEKTDDEEEELESSSSDTDSEETPAEVKSQEGSDQEESKPELPRRSSRERRAPDRYQPVSICLVQHEPANYEEILTLPESEKKEWLDAINSELTSMKKLRVYRETELPPGQKTIGCRWVFKKKPLAEGGFTCKARLVAKGYLQRKFVNFDETFAPTIQVDSIRICLGIAAQRKCVVSHFDIQTAYLNSDLAETIYMDIPPGVKGKKSNSVWKLQKSLYGLHQAGRNWNQCLHAVLQKLGFKNTKGDPCVYTRKDQILMIFVDDLAFICPNQEAVDKFEQEIADKFAIRNLGRVKTYVGINIEHLPEGGFALHQNNKIAALLEAQNMKDCKPVSSPMIQGCFSVDEQESQPFDTERYQSVVGSLQYLALSTRPDIAFAVNMVSRYSSKPTEGHWKAVKRILRYLKGTMNHALVLQPSDKQELKFFVDSDFAGSLEDRKSTSGYVVKYADTVVSWKTHKQNSVSLSTAESEFIALSEVCTNLPYFITLFRELQVQITEPVTVMEDNTACIHLATSESVKGRSKNIDIRYACVREAVKTKQIKLRYCPSAENQADIFTKPLTAQKHTEATKLLGVEDLKL